MYILCIYPCHKCILSCNQTRARGAARRPPTRHSSHSTSESDPNLSITSTDASELPATLPRVKKDPSAASKSPKVSKKKPAQVKNSDGLDDLFGDVGTPKVSASSDIISKIEDEMEKDEGTFSSKNVNKVVFNPSDDLFAAPSSIPKQQKAGNIFDDIFPSTATKGEPKPSFPSAGLFSEPPKPTKATKTTDNSIFDNPPEDIFASPPQSSNVVDIFATDQPSTRKTKSDSGTNKPAQQQTQVEGAAMDTVDATGEAQSQEVIMICVYLLLISFLYIVNKQINAHIYTLLNTNLHKTTLAFKQVHCCSQPSIERTGIGSN